jgi:hypothetical protein
LMRIRFWIQLITLMRIRIIIRCGSRISFDADPGYKNDANSHPDPHHCSRHHRLWTKSAKLAADSKGHGELDGISWLSGFSGLNSWLKRSAHVFVHEELTIQEGGGCGGRAAQETLLPPAGPLQPNCRPLLRLSRLSRPGQASTFIKKCLLRFTGLKGLYREMDLTFDVLYG